MRKEETFQNLIKNFANNIDEGLWETSDFLSTKLLASDQKRFINANHGRLKRTDMVPGIWLIEGLAELRRIF